MVNDPDDPDPDFHQNCNFGFFKTKFSRFAFSWVPESASCLVRWSLMATNTRLVQRDYLHTWKITIRRMHSTIQVIFQRTRLYKIQSIHRWQEKCGQLNWSRPEKTTLQSMETIIMSLNMFFVQNLAHCILPDNSLLNITGIGTGIFDSLLNITLSAPCIV